MSPREAAPVVLVVDDNHANLMLSRAVLEGAGYTVVGAGSGAEMEALLPSVHPDLILMDLELPDGSGVELTRRLKARRDHRAIPVLAVSAHAMEAHREQALAAGCTAFLSKPIDIHELERAVASALAAG